MNKQEVISKLKSAIPKNNIDDYQRGEAAGLNFALLLLSELDDPEKPVVPQVAVEFYERYKDDNLALGEWFGDFYSPEAIEEFPRMDELTKWLHDNNNETNRQREFALATLVTLGIDAVEVEKEKLYTVEIPNPNGGEYGRVFLGKYSCGKVGLHCWTSYKQINFDNSWKKDKIAQKTETEIKKDFAWAWEFAEEVE